MKKTYTEASMFDDPPASAPTMEHPTSACHATPASPADPAKTAPVRSPSSPAPSPLILPPVSPDPAVSRVFSRLSTSPFRSRFRLTSADRAYAEKKGRETVASHTRDFILTRLAPACPDNDGKQTPMRGHPTFPAQHATATCCRSCLEKWHRIPQGRPLTEPEIAYVTSLIMEWIDRQINW